MANRVTLISREELPEDERRFRDAVAAIRRRPISGPFIPTLRSSPDLAARIAHLGHYFHARGQSSRLSCSRVHTMPFFLRSAARIAIARM